MSRINTCQACNFIIGGVKSRRAIEHTCGKTPEQIMEFIKKHKPKDRVYDNEAQMRNNEDMDDVHLV